MWKHVIAARSWQLSSRSKSRAGRASHASLPISRAYMISNGYWPATVNNQANQSRSRSSRFYESMSELGDNRDEVIIHTLLPNTDLLSYIQLVLYARNVWHEEYVWHEHLIMIHVYETSLPHMLTFIWNDSTCESIRLNLFI